MIESIDYSGQFSSNSSSDPQPESRGLPYDIYASESEIEARNQMKQTAARVEETHSAGEDIFTRRWIRGLDVPLVESPLASAGFFSSSRSKAWEEEEEEELGVETEVAAPAGTFPEERSTRTVDLRSEG